MHNDTKFWRGPIFWARTLQAGLLCIVMVAMLGAGQSQYDRVGHNLMCSCGCGQILLECNHVGCPDSARMIDELRAQVATGSGDNAIQNWFVAKYGATVLAAPMRGGFDDVAWIVPISVFVLATAGTFGVVWMWKRRANRMVAVTAVPGGGIGEFPASGVSNVQDVALRERIRRETEY